MKISEGKITDIERSNITFRQRVFRLEKRDYCSLKLSDYIEAIWLLYMSVKHS